MKPRPTEAEFEELKRKRGEEIRAIVKKVCEEQGWDPSKASFHASHSVGCYCACPDGPCQHVWDGPDWESDDGCTVSRTCSRCDAIAMHHDMRVMP